MPYYRAGDYYRGGDYYRAGGIFSFVGKAVKAVARVVGAVAPGPIGMVARAIAPPANAGGRVTFFPPEPSIPNPFVQPMLPPGISSYPVGQTNGGGGGNYPAGGGQGMAMVACPTKGTRMNKSTYVTRGGGTSHWPQELIVHPKGTECVKTRRLNVANPRALRRALRRASGFVKLARRAHVRLSQFTGRKTTRKRK